VQPIRNRQVISSNLIGGSARDSGFSPEFTLFRSGKTAMFYPKHHEQTILEILRGYISATADSVLTDPGPGQHI
jgi:hypothetical protein